MSREVYFLNDFQKSTIKGIFSKFDIFFEDGFNSTSVFMKHPKILNGACKVCSSVGFNFFHDNYSSSFERTHFKKSVEDIVKSIESCINHYEIME